MLVEISRVETKEVFQQFLAIAALILDVMDGKDRLGAVELRRAGALLQQVDGGQGGLPVVDVEHVGVPVQMGGRLHHGAGEEGEALGIVIVSIEPGALEVVLVVHKVIGDAVPLELEDTAVGGAPGQDYMEVEEVGHLVPPLLPDPLVEGEDDADVVACRSQCLRQTARHVGQTAGLDEGGDLRGSKQNIHIG